MNGRPESRYLIAPDVVFCELQDTMVLLDTRQGSYYSLNAVAAECWGLLEERRPVDEIARRIAETYAVPGEICRPHIDQLLDDLVKAGLLETSDA